MPSVGDVADWSKLLANLPFAVIVAAYLLFRMEKVLTKLAENEVLEIEILRRIEENSRRTPTGSL